MSILILFMKCEHQ